MNYTREQRKAPAIDGNAAHSLHVARIHSSIHATPDRNGYAVGVTWCQSFSTTPAPFATRTLNPEIKALHADPPAHSNPMRFLFAAQRQDNIYSACTGNSNDASLPVNFLYTVVNVSSLCSTLFLSLGSRYTCSPSPGSRRLVRAPNSCTLGPRRARRHSPTSDSLTPATLPSPRNRD